jgi:hypothetical protein
MFGARSPSRRPTLVDLRAGLRKDDVGATVFVRNVGDERGQLGSFSLGDVDVAIQRSRTIGVSIGYSF